MSDIIIHDPNDDGIDPRGFLKCMARAGTGALLVMQGGVLKSFSMSQVEHQEVTHRLAANSSVNRVSAFRQLLR